MTYETLAKFAQQGGAIYFLVLFVVGAAYGLWPKKRAEFERAARLPLDEDLEP